MGDATVPPTARSSSTYDLVLRPRPSIVRSTALSVVFSAVPLVVALVWVSFPVRTLAVLVTAVVVLAAVVGLAFVRLRFAFVGVGPQIVTVRGLVTPARTVPRADVAGLVLGTTFGSSVDRTTRELVALDADGSRLFRMRADVWGDDAIDEVVDALGVQIDELRRPMPARDFARRTLRSADETRTLRGADEARTLRATDEA